MKKAVKGIVIAVCCIVLALIVLFAIFEAYLARYLGDKEPYDISAKPIEDEITVMSFNVRYRAIEDLFKKSWPYRASLVKEVVADVAPDLIGFQEVTPTHEKYLKSHLAGYGFFVAYRQNTMKEGMLIAYRKDRFTLQDEGYFWLSETPEKMSKDWGTSSYRIAAYVTLTDTRTGETLTVIDTHLDNSSAEARAKGMIVIIEQMASRSAGKIILMGDMNDYEGTSMFVTATTNGLKDGRNSSPQVYDGSGSTWHDYGNHLNDQRIDFFFVSTSVTVNDYFVYDKTFDGVYPSDHFPIVLKINL